MATYRTTITTTSPVDVVFDYLSRFSSAVEWDPGVVEAKELTPGAVAVGSVFELTVRTLGRESPYRYEVTVIDRPRHVRLRAETSAFVSTDLIDVSADGAATVVTYEARLDTTGFARLIAPVLPLAFKRVGDRAAAGLRRELDQLAQRDRLDPPSPATAPRGGEPTP